MQANLEDNTKPVSVSEQGGVKRHLLIPLRPLFVLLVGIPLVLLAAALLVYVFYTSREETARQTKTLIESEVVSRAKTLDRYFSIMMSGPDHIAQSLTIRKPQNLEEMLQLQYAMLADNPIIYGNVIAWEPFAFNPKEKHCCLYVWREKQNRLAHKMFSPETDYDYLSKEWDWYDDVREKYAPSLPAKRLLDFPDSKLKEDEFVRIEPGIWSKPYFDDGGGNVLMTTYSAPFFQQGKFTGVVTCDVTTDWINNFLSDNKMKDAGFILCDISGNIISCQKKDFIMKDIGDIVRAGHLKSWYKPLKEAEKLTLDYQPFQAKEYSEESDLKCIAEFSCEAENIAQENVRVQLAATQIPATGWILIYSVPVKSIYSAVNAGFWNVSVFLLIILPFLFVYIYWFFNRQVVVPVQNLTKATREVAIGNFDYRLTVSRQDSSELQELEENFNLMAAALQKRVEEEVQYAAEKELLEASNQAKSDILMLAGHELRTPLTGSIGTTNLLLQTDLTEKQRQYVDLQRESNTALLFLINNILDYSKLSVLDKTELHEKIFFLRETIAAASSLMKLQADAKNCTIRAEYADDVPNKIFGEESRIRQLLANLLGNAVKFSNNSEILIKVSVDGNPCGDMSVGRIPVLFEVIDRGIGVLPEHSEHLFEPQKQENVSTRSYDGMGLGLTISKSLVKSLGGKIGYRETSGGGSTFWFSVPLSEAAFTCIEPDSAPAELESDDGIEHILPSGRTYRILVAEDNRINRIVVNEMLKADGFDVAMAEDGQKAVEAWQSAEQPFDLILMDCQMPNMDGYEAAELIRRIEKEKNIRNPIPIVALTANAAPQDKERCLKIGMNAYHNKPIDAPDLLRTLQHWIRKEL